MRVCEQDELPADLGAFGGVPALGQLLFRLGYEVCGCERLYGLLCGRELGQLRERSGLRRDDRRHQGGQEPHVLLHDAFRPGRGVYQILSSQVLRYDTKEVLSTGGAETAVHPYGIYSPMKEIVDFIYNDLPHGALPPAASEPAEDAVTALLP